MQQLRPRPHPACRRFQSSLSRRLPVSSPVVVILAASDGRCTRLSTVGDRALPVAASRLWNNLPSDVNADPTARCFSELRHLLPRLPLPAPRVKCGYEDADVERVKCRLQLSPNGNSNPENLISSKKVKKSKEGEFI